LINRAQIYSKFPASNHRFEVICPATLRLQQGAHKHLNGKKAQGLHPDLKFLFDQEKNTRCFIPAIHAYICSV
jgi:hypothetical protein